MLITRALPLFLSALLMLPMLSRAASVTGGGDSGRVVVFEVDMTEEIAAARFVPSRDRIGVRGAVAPLSWARTQEAVRVHAAGALYRVVVQFPPEADRRQGLQYKWKVDRAGFGPDDGWEAGRNHLLALKLGQQTVSRKFGAAPEPVPLQRTGHIERIAPGAWFEARHVAAREVQIWLPGAYQREPTRRFPVLYMQDGQTLFDAAVAGAEWQMDEAAQRLIERAEVAPFIIVAVHHGERRIDDYTPTRITMDAQRSGSGRPQTVGGDAPRYARYLIEELKPEIDRRYRTLPAREHTSVGGASLGGLFALWLALHEPTVFGAALVVSPSVWWDDALLLREAKSVAVEPAQRPRLWLDMGVAEGPEAIRHVRQLRDALLARGWDARSLRYVEDPEGSHDEASWAQRTPDMLRFLYGPGEGSGGQPPPAP